jgi:diguanylate cyclase (GGDEF)-like protein
VARGIVDSLRDNDDLAFRYGGEEFSVILPSAGLRGGTLVAERIRENISKSVFEKGSYNLKVTLSIGVSACPDNALTIKDLILGADKALYEAKKSGKNKVVVCESQ